jgi:hypothetical protein
MGKRKLELPAEEEAGGAVRRWTYQMGHLSSLPILSRFPRSAIPMPSVPPHSGSLRSTSLLSFRAAAMTNSDFVVGIPRAGSFTGGVYLGGSFPSEVFVRSKFCFGSWRAQCPPYGLGAARLESASGLPRMPCGYRVHVTLGTKGHDLEYINFFIGSP